MILIRKYTESDAIQVGVLIADTYSEYNLSFASPDQKNAFLGPFQHAKSLDKSHRDAIADVIKASMVFVAEMDGVIVGVLRGRKVKLQSLFVRVLFIVRESGANWSTDLNRNVRHKDQEK